MSKRLTQYLLAPPIQVLYEGKTVGGDFDELLNKEWAEDQAFEMDRPFVDKVAELTGLSFSKGIQVKILTATLSKHALTTKLKGQILVIYVSALPDAETPMQYESASFKLEAGEGTLKLTFTKDFKDGEKKRSETATANLSAILGVIRVPVEITQERTYPHEDHRLGGMRISHNGIRIPENERSIQLDDYVINSAGPWRTACIIASVFTGRWWTMYWKQTSTYLLGLNKIETIRHIGKITSTKNRCLWFLRQMVSTLRYLPRSKTKTTW